MFVIDFIAIGIGLIGAAIIIWGVLKTAVEFIVFEARSLLKDATCRQRESIRIKLGSYLLIGLEFLIAADVIQTVRNPELTEIAMLGAIVAIRTVISFFLNREIEQEGI
jgi:uncharacterized membrane protein